MLPIHRFLSGTLTCHLRLCADETTVSRFIPLHFCSDIESASSKSPSTPIHSQDLPIRVASCRHSPTQLPSYLTLRKLGCQPPPCFSRRGLLASSTSIRSISTSDKDWQRLDLRFHLTAEVWTGDVGRYSRTGLAWHRGLRDAESSKTIMSRKCPNLYENHSNS